MPITDIMAQTPEIPDNCQWGLFLRNHDELTLEMVTDEERDYMYLAYSADPRMRINIGIRRRLAPLMDNNRRRIELLNSLLFSFPGTPILYYGDEIGMGDNIYLGDRNGVRTPMQWSGDRNAGFSRAIPAKLYSPVIMDPVYGYEAVNVEAQQSDPSSLLHWMRNMIALRKLFQVFGRGTLEFLHPSNRKVLAYVRRYEGEQVLCVANLSRFAQPVELDLSAFAGMVRWRCSGYVEFPAIGRQPYPLTLGPYGFLWFELQAPARARKQRWPDSTGCRSAPGGRSCSPAPGRGRLEIGSTARVSRRSSAGLAPSRGGSCPPGSPIGACSRGSRRSPSCWSTCDTRRERGTYLLPLALTVAEPSPRFPPPPSSAPVDHAIRETGTCTTPPSTARPATRCCVHRARRAASNAPRRGRRGTRARRWTGCAAEAEAR